MRDGIKAVSLICDVKNFAKPFSITGVMPVLEFLADLSWQDWSLTIENRAETPGLRGLNLTLRCYPSGRKIEASGGWLLKDENGHITHLTDQEHESLFRPNPKKVKE